MSAAVIRWSIAGSVAASIMVIYALGFASFASTALFTTVKGAPLLCFPAMFAGLVLRRDGVDLRKLALIGAIVSLLLVGLLVVCAVVIDGAEVSPVFVGVCALLSAVLLGGVVTTRLIVKMQP